MSNNSLTQADWQKWFGDLTLDHSDNLFHQWQKLSAKLEYLQKLLKQKGKLNLTSTQKELDIAKEKLKFDKHYRVVVIGETGAGKSTLINALMAKELLPAKAGAAVTGTATLVYPNIDIQKELATHFKDVDISLNTSDFLHGFVRIIWREDQDFRDLLDYYSIQYDLALLNSSFSGKEITPDFLLYDVDAKNELEAQLSGQTDRKKTQVIEEIEDIATTWKLIRSGNHKLWDKPIPISEHQKIESLLSENSANNQDQTKRLIPGIKYAEYFLPNQENKSADFCNLKDVVVIDTPGSGASIIRHHAILQKEVEKANAVILVMRADRINVQQNQDITDFLQSSLFGEYETIDRSDFARKVFLVANKADTLLGNQGDRVALEQSVIKLCKIISPDYWERYGKKTNRDCRYFEILSLSALLAIQKKQGNQGNQKLYTSQTSLLGLEATVEDADQVLEKSQLPYFSQQLKHFLSSQRIDLMLREASIHTSRAEEKLRLTCEDLLKAKGLEVEDSLVDDLQQRNQHHRQIICRASLDKSSGELYQVIEDVIESLNHWVRTTSNAQLLFEEQLQDVAISIQGSLKKYLLGEMENNMEAGVVVKTWNDLSGRYHIEGLPEKLLLQAQTYFYREIENKSKKLADHYLNQFDTEVVAQGIYEKFDEKTYGQSYLINIEFDHKIQQYQEEFKSNYRAIYRWILMYELVKMPMLFSSEDFAKQKNDNSVQQKIFENATQDISSDLKFSVVASKPDISSVVDSMVRSPLNLFVDIMAKTGNPDVSDVQEKSTYSQQEYAQSDMVSLTQESESLIPGTGNDQKTKVSQLLDQRQLIERIKTLIGKNEFDECIRVIQQQISLRYNLSTGVSLTFLETLFFYELGKFRFKLFELAKILIERHRANIETGNMSIQEALITEDSDEGEEISQALEILEALDAQTDS